MFGKKSSDDEIVVQKNPCVVLALPSSGPYSPIAAKIRKGAKLAADQLASGGIQTKIVEINTENADWLQKLNALPEQCAVVGGPMQEKAWLQARDSGAIAKRVFFAFMSNLPGQDEGQRAWRFFPGPRDQVDALVNFAVDDLGIRSFGAFYPDDNYGRRMTGILEERLGSKNASLEKAPYNSAASATWNKVLATLIKPESMGKNAQPIPHTSFEAIFLPDSWKQMDKITTSLLYNGEDRLVLLGTTLWEQGISGKQIPKAGKYSLAVFPAAWDKSKSPKALQAADNDFWSALGYDFLKFAVNTGLIGRLDNSRIITRANHAAAFMQAMSPVFYDGQGHARQKMGIYQVTASGPKPVNVETFKQTRQSVQEQAALRMQTSRESALLEAQRAQESPEMMREESIPGEPAVSEESASPSPAPVMPATAKHVNYPSPAMPPIEAKPAAPAVPQRQILSPVPQPSYKLRLPGKRP